MRNTLLACALLLLISCTNGDADQPIPTNATNTGAIEYGNGVYYINASRQAFGLALVAFRKENPNLTILASGVIGTLVTLTLIAWRYFRGLGG